MKIIKILLAFFPVFFILAVPFSLKAAEKDVIKEWMKEDMEKAAVNRMEELVAQREKEGLAAARPKIKQLYRDAGDLIKSGRYDDAKGKCQEILTISPDERKAQEYIAKIERIQAVVREREMERAMARKGKEEKEKIQKLVQEGAELYRLKNYSAAREKWEEVLLQEPDNEDIKTWIDRARFQEVEKARQEAMYEKELKEKTALTAIDEAYAPRRKKEISREKAEQEIVKEEKTKKIEEMLETIEIELHLKDVDLRRVVTEIIDKTKVNILVDWTAISEATGVSTAAAAPQDEGVEEGAPPAAGSGEIKTMHLDLEFYTPMPLRALLDYLMKMTRLKYRVEEHAVLISTPQALEREEMEVKVYKLKYGMTKLRPVTLKPLGKEEE